MAASTQWGSIADWVVAGIAFFALIQPWLFALRQRIRARLGIYETGLIEIGYSSNGPTVAFLGTLQALGNDLFVRTIAATVTNLDTRSQHHFRWQASREQTVKGSPGGTIQQETILHLPNGFMVNRVEAKTVNVVLVDRKYFQSFSRLP